MIRNARSERGVYPGILWGTDRKQRTSRKRVKKSAQVDEIKRVRKLAMASVFNKLRGSWKECATT